VGLVLSALAALLAVALAAPAAAPAQVSTGDRSEQAQVTDLVNALLGGLMGNDEMTGPELQEAVAKAGGIPFRWDVPIAFMSKAELDAYLREVIASEYPASVAHLDERLLEGFDLLAPGTNLAALRERLLEENVVGFYDERPGRRRLYAVSDDRRLTPMNQIVLAHELRHALQDQYEELHSELPDDVSDFDDRRVALMSLLEGDATLVMERFLESRLGGLGALAGGAGLGPGGLDADLAGGLDADLGLPGLDGMEGVPPVVRDDLVMPYLAGRELARAIEARGGSDAMLAAWRRPPESTEQVLHPEKFFARELPWDVVPGPDPPGGTLLSQGVLGELLLRTLVEEPGASKAAAGWGGDTWRLWDVDGRTALVWRSVWDTPDDAVEFEEALRARFARHRGKAEAVGTWSVFGAGDGWRFALRRKADVVELRSAEDGERLRKMLD
jgi:DNA-binding transcriptional ArsR family regulator